MLAGIAVQHRGEDRKLHHQRQHLRQNLFGARMEEVARAGAFLHRAPIARTFQPGQREQLLDLGNLRGQVLEDTVGHIGLVDLTLGVSIDQALTDLLGPVVVRLVRDAHIRLRGRQTRVLEGRLRLLAVDDQFDLQAARLQLFVEFPCRAHDVAVEGRAQATVRGHHDHHGLLRLRMLDQERVLDTAGKAGQIADHLAQFAGVGPRGHGSHLRLGHARGRDHFHGLRDLARILDALAPRDESAWIGHDLAFSAYFFS